MTAVPYRLDPTAQQSCATQIPLKVIGLCSVEMEKQLQSEETDNEWSTHKLVRVICMSTHPHILSRVKYISAGKLRIL